jgi:transposase
MKLADEQWALLEPHIPKAVRRADGKGRPRCDARRVLQGVLWVLRTGAQWKELPVVEDGDPSYQTCHRWFQRWARGGVLAAVLRALAEDLLARGEIDLAECFIDGSFSPARGAARKSVRPSGARASRSWPSPTAPACR